MFVNGGFAGYGTDSRLPSEYDITDLVNAQRSSGPASAPAPGGSAPAPAQASGTACPACGTMGSGKFCANCGQALAAPRTCAGCGTALSAGAKFCGTCGKPG